MSCNAVPESPDSRSASPPEQLAQRLREIFGSDFALLDAQGEPSPGLALPQLLPHRAFLTDAAWQCLQQQEPLLLGAPAGLRLLALPVADEAGSRFAALALFAVEGLTRRSAQRAACRQWKLDPAELQPWLLQRTHWSSVVLLRHAEMVLALLKSERRRQRLQYEVEMLSENLASTYEEISVLYQATDHLRRPGNWSHRISDLMGWLLDTLPAESLVLQATPATPGAAAPLRTWGKPRLSSEQFLALVERVCDRFGGNAVVVNHPTLADTTNPPLRQLILVPVVEGEQPWGWLAALNCTVNGSFGSHQARLLQSIAAILGNCYARSQLVQQEVAPLLFPNPAVLHAMGQAR